MIVTSTEMQNNFGKYLLLSAREEIVITRNGTPVARLTAAAGEEILSGEGNYGAIAEMAEGYASLKRKVTYEEFRELTQKTEERYEYIDGEIYLLASPKTAHQSAVAELFGIFYTWFQGKDCRPLVAPFDITLTRNPENTNVVQPDIMVICDLEEKLNEKDYYTGVPELMVEVLSEGTRSKDLVKKLDLYLSCGVREYWVVNPINAEVTVYLFEACDIGEHATYKKGEIARSYIFEGLSAELDRVFR